MDDSKCSELHSVKITFCVLRQDWHNRCYLKPAKSENAWTETNRYEHILEMIMADNVKDTIKDAGKSVGDAAKKTGEKVKDGASKVADKAADATKSAGKSVKKAGQSIKDKSGK